MLKIIDNDIYRDAEKIGWLQNSHIFDHKGVKLGHFDDKYIYNRDGKKIAYVEGDDLRSETNSFPELSLDKINEDVEGGMLPETGKAAVYLLLGE